MSSRQRTFSDVKEDLHPAAKDLLDMPDYAQVDANLVNMSNFFPLIKGLIDAVKPVSICEVGSDQGMTTRLLQRYCSEHECQLHSVDPGFAKTEKIDEVFHQHSCLSVQYLESQPPSDVYFLDGDHNYHTMDAELRLIQANKTDGKSCVIFIHDVGWPWGKIDMFYDIENIPEGSRKTTCNAPVMSMYRGQSGEDGKGLPMDGLNVALENQGKSGIATAIQEFLSEHGEWEYLSIPSIFGLGILTFVQPGDDRVASALEQVRRVFKTSREFLAILEFNRIALLEQINHAGVIWSRQQEAIKEYAEAVRWFEKQRDGQSRELAALREEITAMKEELSSVRAALGEKDAELEKLSSPLYWIKRRFRGDKREL